MFVFKLLILTIFQESVTRITLWNKTGNKSIQNQTTFSLLLLIVHIIKITRKIDSLIIQAVRLNQIALKSKVLIDDKL